MDINRKEALSFSVAAIAILAVAFVIAVLFIGDYKQKLEVAGRKLNLAKSQVEEVRDLVNQLIDGEEVILYDLKGPFGSQFPGIQLKLDTKNQVVHYRLVKEIDDQVYDFKTDSLLSQE